MPPSYQKCLEILTAPGQLLEIEEKVIFGQKIPVYKNLPPTYRSFLLSRMDKYSPRVLVSSHLPSAEHGVGKRETVTFGEIKERAVALAAWLRNEHGVRVGDRVATGGYNCAQWIVVFVAIHILGAIPVVLNASNNTDSLVHCLRLTQPKVVLVDAQTADALSGTWSEKLKPKSVGQIYCWGKTKAQEVNHLPAYKPSTAQVREILDDKIVQGLHPDSDGSIFFTSGTTGYPKAVLSTQRAGLSNLYSVLFPPAVSALRKGAQPAPPPEAHHPQKAHLLAIPMFHVTGTLSWLMRAFNGGTKLVLMERWNVAIACELIKTEEINLIGGVPAIATAMLQTPLLPKTANFDGVTYGGAPAPARLATDCAARWPNASVTQGYGLTETNAYACGLSGADYLARPKSTGPAAPICKVQIRDAETGKVLPAGEAGVIHIRGANIMKEYLNDPEATAKAIDSEGWFDSGDIGYLDEENFLYISDRAKDMIIRGGENVASAEVENAILSDDRLAQAAAVAVPDDFLGERVGVAVSLRPGKTATEESILQLVQSKLRKQARPDVVLIWHEAQLPTNANGKIIKKDLRPLVAAEWERKQKASSRNARL